MKMWSSAKVVGPQPRRPQNYTTKARLKIYHNIMDSPTSAHSIRPNPQQNEMSIAVLNAISETPLLSAKAAQEWVSQLDNAILSTKVHSHVRILKKF